MRRKVERFASIEIFARGFESMPLTTRNSVPVKQRRLQLQLKVERRRQMRTVKSLLLLLVVQISVCAQQAPAKPTTPTSRCHGCPRRVAKRVIPPPQVPA